jgi:ubiquinone biosynthesis protein
MRNTFFRSPFRSVRNLRRFQVIGSVFLKHGFGFIFDRFGPELRALRRTLRQPFSFTSDPSLTEEELAIHFRLALEELGPTFVKLGQILSTRPDLLPPIFIVELSKLQDKVPPAPWEDIEKILLEDYDNSFTEIFATIDHVPMAAASLAQVYAATLSNGAEVVLKVQRPGIIPVIETDLEIIQTLAAIAQPTPLGRFYDLTEIAEEFAFTLRNELDYNSEGHNADRFRQNFADAEFLYIPKVYWEYTTPRVLVLERIHGIKINNIKALEAEGYDRHQIAMNAAHLIVQEVLVDGFFHADPHPGNLFIMPGHVIGAMDFGMVGHLKESDRRHLIQLYIAAIQQDIDAIIDQFIRMGAAGVDVDQVALGRDIDRLLSHYYGRPLKDMRAADVIERIQPVVFEHRLKLPSAFWLLGKTLMIMEGVGLQLDPDFDIYEVSGPYVRRLIWQLILPGKNWSHQVLRKTTDWGNLFDEFPRTANRLLELIEHGQFFRLSIVELDPLLNRVDRLVTRISLALLVAALIVGLSLLIPLFSSGSVGQIILIAGFVFVVGLGLWLLLTMLRR